MAAGVRFEIDHKEIGKLLKGAEMQRILKDVANRIAAAAGEGMEPEVTVGPNRAHAIVRTATFKARHAEARDRALTRALDAGR